MEPDTGLKGFYGSVTMEDYAQKPGPGLGLGRGMRKVKGWRRKGKEAS